MTLLKGDDSIPKKPQLVNLTSWPAERRPEGLGLSINDGWYFGIGFGLAMTVALPVILMAITLIVGVILAIIGAL
jgi:hypothetical protein